jgi:glycosyltransferase involved in cell wall biosynthesis
MMESPHFQKWLRVVQHEFPEKRILVFSSDRPHLSKSRIKQLRSLHSATHIFRLIPAERFNFITYYILDNLLSFQWRAYFLARVIMRHKPAIIHFHETQHAAYIFNLISTYRGIPCKSRNIISTWGSDLTLYSWVENHKPQIISALSWTDLLTAEKKDELADAKRLGYSGEFKAPIYITLGTPWFDETNVALPSLRRIVLIKGYQDNPGRALNVLNVISQLKLELVDFEILVYSASEAVRIQVDFLRNKHFMNIRILEKIAHHDMQELFKSARVSIGMSISDGLPAALVEAMQGGAFPVQSENSCVRDLIVHGQGGFIVDPWDLISIRENLQKALTDDLLVDRAFAINRMTLNEKFSIEVGISRLKSLYL